MILTLLRISLDIEASKTPKYDNLEQTIFIESGEDEFTVKVANNSDG
jgi:hypothetical protein